MKICKIAVGATTALIMFADVRRNILSNPEKTLQECYQEFRSMYGVEQEEYNDDLAHTDYYRILKRMRNGV